MTMLRLKAKDLMNTEKPMDFATRIDDWNQLGGEFELFEGLSRKDYVLEARFSSDEVAMEFLTYVHGGDKVAALEAWRHQP